MENSGGRWPTHTIHEVCGERATTHPPLAIDLEVAPDRIAELILKGFGDHDAIVFADQLQATTFAPSSPVSGRRRS
jgi:hypothetical protein